MATRIPTGVRNDLVQRIQVLLDAGAGPGTFDIRTGAQPASANDAASGTLLATLTLSDPSAGAAAAGVLTLSAISDDVSIDATGTAGWARGKDSTGATVVDVAVSVTGGGAELQFNSVAFQAAAIARITAFTITMPAG